MAYSHIDISSVVDVSDWPTLEEELAGSRAKKTIVDPDTKKLCVFKEPKVKREAQIWSELIASYIAGDLLGWAVQRTRIAMRDGRIGNLLDYIYDDDQTFQSGEQFCKHVDPEYDPKLGRRHTWDLIKRIRSDPILEGLDEQGYVKFWARAIALDTLISNTDRHAENWAILRTYGTHPTSMEMAPLYDNATSMGCEVDERGLDKWFLPNGGFVVKKVQNYFANGCHHISDGQERYKLTDLATKVISDFPTSKPEFICAKNIELEPIERVLNEISQMAIIPQAAQMSEKRKLQIMLVLQEGKDRIIRALKNL